jgi:hypothetical protein
MGAVCRKLTSLFLPLSLCSLELQHKFASNVVEKCLQYGSKAERNDIIEEVVRSVLEK